MLSCINYICWIYLYSDLEFFESIKIYNFFNNMVELAWTLRIGTIPVEVRGLEVWQTGGGGGGVDREGETQKQVLTRSCWNNVWTRILLFPNAFGLNKQVSTFYRGGLGQGGVRDGGALGPERGSGWGGVELGQGGVGGGLGLGFGMGAELGGVGGGASAGATLLLSFVRTTVDTSSCEEK